MNASSFIGQVSSAALVGYLRVPILVIISTFCCSVILFGMIGVHTVAGVVVFGVLYGYFAGICTSPCLINSADKIWLGAFLTMLVCAVLSLWTPVMTLLTPDLSELG